MLRFFFQRDDAAHVIEFNDPITLRVIHIRGKDDSAAGVMMHADLFTKPRTVKNVVAQNQCNVVITDERFTNRKRLCQSLALWLHGIADFTSDPATITQKGVESSEDPAVSR